MYLQKNNVIGKTILGGIQMSIIKKNYGEINGEAVYSFILDNGMGLSAEILNYGGIISRLIYDGVDVICGRDSLDEYLDNPNYFGAIIGRNTNRIEDAHFELNGKTYTLYKNDGDNNHHGGNIGFNKKIWEAETIDGDEPSLVLSLISPDGDEGFPGELKVKVTYTVTADNAIKIHYEGECDADTIVNMTSHGYFNLNGHDSGLVDGHKLWINSDFYTPIKTNGAPSGEVLSVTDTPFDLREGVILGDIFPSKHAQISMHRGYDHNFAVRGYGYRPCAKAVGDKTGIVMEVYTDCSGVHLYTANYAEEDRVCKGGAKYPVHSAFCFETQSFPNAVNISHFPNGFLKKGDKYDTVTSYKFLK